jgi:hypothetical protein
MIDCNTAGPTRPSQTLTGLPPGKKCVRAVAVILIALANIAITGCATGGTGEAGYVTQPTVTAPSDTPATAADPSAKKAGAVVGVWQGLSLANCSTSPENRCNAQQKITLTFLEGDSGLTGYYRCAYGTMNCYNMNETGKIVSATLNGGQMTARVAMPDGTSCIYTGRTSGNDITGGYSCYGGGGQIESGSWKGQRSY